MIKGFNLPIATLRGTLESLWVLVGRYYKQNRESLPMDFFCTKTLDTVLSAHFTKAVIQLEMVHKILGF